MHGLEPHPRILRGGDLDLYTRIIAPESLDLVALEAIRIDDEEVRRVKRLVGQAQLDGLEKIVLDDPRPLLKF